MIFTLGLEVPMTTYDDRLASLERKVATLELRRLHDESLAQENTPPEQGRNLREINENMTILLGVTGKRGQDIRAVKSDLDAFKEHVDQRFTSLEGKLDQVLQMVTTLVKRIGE